MNFALSASYPSPRVSDEKSLNAERRSESCTIHKADFRPDRVIDGMDAALTGLMSTVLK